MLDSNVSRRDVVLGGIATLAALRGGPVLAAGSGEWRLGDAHAHLFNLADLPARGFFEHGVAWNTKLSLWPLRFLWPALLDLVEYLKSHSITAEQELESFVRDSSATPNVDGATFERLAFGRIAWMSRRWRPRTLMQRHLRGSYRQLATVIGIVGTFDPPSDPEERGPILDDADIQRIRNGGSRLFKRRCPEAPHTAGPGGGTGQMIDAIINWARDMMQSRQCHLAQHRARIADTGLSPTTIVNLLVDYDSWLGDAPAPRSGHDAQVRLWERIRREYSGEVDIRTFAGFDPLRDAEERIALGDRYAAESRFARDRGHVAAGRIHGFKVYPPMGFRPLGNEPAMFEGPARARGVVRRRWQSLGLDHARLAERLDEALIRLYTYCAAHHVPILTHAYHGNEASRCAGAYASPALWIRVLEEFPELRVCIGHFTEADDFDVGMRRRERVPARVWPLRGLERLLARNRPGQSRAYVDIGDMVELLDPDRGTARAVRFFENLRRYCGDYDRNCEHFMFGSDWIMLGRAHGHEQYLSTIRAAMNAAGWPDQWHRNLLHDNLQRFLDPDRA